MVVMNLTADNILGFTDFAINFLTPRKLSTPQSRTNIFGKGPRSATRRLLS